MASPYVSICIPAYKNIIFLSRLLHSVRIQTFTDFEIIVTDDNPGDEISNLVNNTFNDLGIRYYKNDPAAGMPGNWNVCMEKAAGQWIKIMHDDDWFSNELSLQEFVGASRNDPGCSFIFSACTDVDLLTGNEEKWELKGWREELLEGSPLNLVYNNVIGHPSVVMHKNIPIQYDPRFKWVVDIDFYIRFLQQSPCWQYIPESLINIGIDKSQLSSQYYKNPLVEIPEYFNLVKKLSFDHLSNIYVFDAFWLLVRKFAIKDFKQIRQAGYEGYIPPVINNIISYQKKIPRLMLKQTPFSEYFMKKCYRAAMKKHPRK